MALGNINGIVLKHSLLLNDVPDPAELQVGELAVNANSGSLALFTLDENGAVQRLGAGGTTGGGLQPSATPPTNPVRGNVWVDLTPVPPALPDLKMYDGANWVVMAKPDGTTIQADPAAGVLGVGVIDMGVMP